MYVFIDNLPLDKIFNSLFFILLFRHLLTALLRRVYLSSQSTENYVDEITQQIVLTPSLKHVPQVRNMRCIRISTSVDHARYGQAPDPCVHYVDLPCLQTLPLVAHLLIQSGYIDHVVPLPQETEHIQFFGIRAPGEYVAWDYYLSPRSASKNLPSIAILPPADPIVIEDEPEGPNHAEDVVSLSGSSSPNVVVLSAPTSPDSSVSVSPGSTRLGSPVSPALANPLLAGLLAMPPSPASTVRAGPSSPVSSTTSSSPIGLVMPREETPRLNALLVSRVIRGQQGPHHLEEYRRPRPSTELACRYMVYRTYRAKIMDFGYSPFNEEHGGDAKGFMIASMDDIQRCINEALKEARYQLNKLTKPGLYALITETGPGSPYQHALNWLNAPNDFGDEAIMPELHLMALFNHSLRSYLTK